jgi:hypothetical protein
VVAWVWLHRRAALKEALPHRLQTEKRPPTRNLQSTALTDVGALNLVTATQQCEQPTDQHLQPSTENPPPAASHESVPPQSAFAEPASVPIREIEVQVFVAHPTMVTERAPAATVEQVGSSPTSRCAASPTTNEIAKLEKALATLSAKDKDLILKVYYGGMNSVQISSATGQSPAAVLMSISRIRAKLRKKLK